MKDMWEFVEMIYRDLNSLEVTLGNGVFRLVMSMLLGALVGDERKR